jgi:hypothetical protein
MLLGSIPLISILLKYCGIPFIVVTRIIESLPAPETEIMQKYSGENCGYPTKIENGYEIQLQGSVFF